MERKRSRVFSDNDPQSLVRRTMLYACGLTGLRYKAMS